MSKDRFSVTCNGRAAFYACMWNDIRQCAMDCGWAVSLHGSLASDMDIMAMPWVDNAVTFKEMIDRVSKLFKDNDMSSQYVITYNEKTHNRVVATIPIWSDFYLDISTIKTADLVEVVRCKAGLLGEEKEMIKSSLRPCMVGETRAIFHGWIEKITPIIKIEMQMTKDRRRAFIEEIKEEYPYLPLCTEAERQKETLAIVEFEGGEIREVKPSEVRFCDKKVQEIWKL